VPPGRLIFLALILHTTGKLVVPGLNLHAFGRLVLGLSLRSFSRNLHGCHHYNILKV
jgi:hypothetical protein